MQYIHSSIHNIAYEELQETILWHVLWKSWNKLRNRIYSLFRVNNIEELLGLLISAKLTKDEFLSKVKKYLNPTPEDYKEVNLLISMGIKIISIFDDVYPVELIKMKNPSEHIYPPLILYHVGSFIDFNNKILIAVVGTRRCSKEGYNFAFELGKALSSKGYVIVNGLARGIDYAATIGALKTKGVVIGVRPWLDVIDTPPKYLTGILNEILDRGCIISENAFKRDLIPWIKMQFQLRNRIISGLSHLVVIVEARKPGGSMHQIEYALKRKKPVLIWKLKTKYNTEFVRAYKEFIKLGAKEFETIDDVLSYIEQNITK